MDSGGSFTFGEFPDDFDSPGIEGTPGQRGWVAPEDRLWRHPSELRSAGVRAPLKHAAITGVARRLGGKWPTVTAGVFGAAVAASVAVAFTMADSPSNSAATGRTIAASDTSLVTTPLAAVAVGGGALPAPVSTSPDVVRMVSAIRSSLVELLPVDSTSTTKQLTGVVLPGGNLVVTAAAAVTGMSQMEVLTSDGRRHRGEVAGIDTRSGVAVVRVADALTPATFADEAVTPPELAVTACLCGGGTTSSATAAPAVVAVGMVRQVGSSTALDGGPSIIDAIEAEMPLGPSSWGSVLLDGRGQVIGILDGQQSVGDDTFGYFVPAPLAVGVAEELAATRHVERGWLGVVCADQPGGGGAVVTTVLPASPASATGLRPGDVIEAVDGHQLGTLADLQ
ncbi:MAG: S1C family serine protease, partial [Acidimicrobiales bacterium]